jgi:hypothetical protein
VLHGELSDDDIMALTDICKSAHGLAEQEHITPLTSEHVPEKTGGSAPVSLVSIFHHRGVNALSENRQPSGLLDRRCVLPWDRTRPPRRCPPTARHGVMVRPDIPNADTRLELQHISSKEG